MFSVTVDVQPRYHAAEVIWHTYYYFLPSIVFY
jgi:hypothetical protein